MKYKLAMYYRVAFEKTSPRVQLSSGRNVRVAVMTRDHVASQPLITKIARSLQYYTEKRSVFYVPKCVRAASMSSLGVRGRKIKYFFTLANF